MSARMHECASLIKLVYENYEKGHVLEQAMINRGYAVFAVLRADPPGVVPHTEIFGTAVVKGGDIFFVFRGTMGVDDWLTNVDMDQTPRGVHSGFAGLHSQMIYYIQYVASIVPDLHVVITGHSLGGAIATLVAQSLSHLLPEVITFASPRVGNTSFAERVNRLVPIQRVFNTEDAVPNLPLAVTPIHTYTHVGTPIPFTKNVGDIRGNHSIDLYIEQVTDL